MPRPEVVTLAGKWLLHFLQQLISTLKIGNSDYSQQPQPVLQPQPELPYAP